MSYGTKFYTPEEWAEEYERQRTGGVLGKRVPVTPTHALVRGDPLLVEFFREAMENATQGALLSAPTKEVKRGKGKTVADRAGRRGRR